MTFPEEEICLNYLEYLNLAKQINATLTGKTIHQGQLGNSPHKFVWYNRRHEEFESLTQGKVIGERV